MSAEAISHGQRTAAGRLRAAEMRDELRAAVRAGEASAAVLADRFGVSERHVDRVRAKLRAAGVRVLLVSPECSRAVGGGSRVPRPCERCAAERPLVEVGDWLVCAECEPRERAKGAPTVTARPTGPVEPMTPTDLFRCEHYRCELMARACIDNQTPRVPEGSPTRIGLARQFNLKRAYCQGGTCAQGALVKLRVEAHRGPAQDPAAAFRAHQERKRERDRDAVAAAVLGNPAVTPPASPASALGKESKPMAIANPLANVSDEAVKAVYAQGGSYAAVAKKFGCSAPTAKKRVVKLGLDDKPSPVSVVAEALPAAPQPTPLRPTRADADQLSAAMRTRAGELFAAGHDELAKELRDVAARLAEHEQGQASQAASESKAA